MGELTALELFSPTPDVVLLHILLWPVLTSPKRLLLAKVITSNIIVNRTVRRIDREVK
jgi:hypothetical protein